MAASSRNEYFYDTLTTLISTITDVSVCETYADFENPSKFPACYIFIDEENFEHGIEEGGNPRQEHNTCDFQIFVLDKVAGDLKSEGKLRKRGHDLLDMIEKHFREITRPAAYTYTYKGTTYYKCNIIHILLKRNVKAIDVEQNEVMLLIEGKINYIITY